MSDDEVFLGLISFAGSFAGLFYWFRSLTAFPPFIRHRRVTLPFQFVLPGCLGFIFLSLRLGADDEVVNHPGYLAILTALGFSWLSLTAALCSCMGISVRDDATERRNSAAVIAICGALIAMTLIYSGSNMGEGPSLWNNVFTASAGTCGLFAVWFALEVATSLSSSITEERDCGSGMRLAGFLIACGMVLGRSLAGTWESAEGTVRDMLSQSAPLVLLLIAAIFTGRALRPSRSNPFPSWKTHGLFPAIFYVIAALAYVLWLGKWD